MRNALIVTTLLAMLGACRSPGLPSEPPEHDASNPDAGVVEARPQANPFTRSAFEGVKLDGAGGHEHHHHGHGAKGSAEPTKGDAPAKAEKTEAPAKSSHDSHGSHGGRS
jgi:hypothetical protein